MANILDSFFAPRLPGSGLRLPATADLALPLANTLVVNKGTLIPVSKRNGAIVTPFDTFSEAETVAGAAATRMFLFTFGDYTAQGPLVVPAGASRWYSALPLVPAVVGAPNVALIASIAAGAGSQLNLMCATVEGATAVASMNAGQTTFGGPITCESAEFDSCVISDNVTATAGIKARNCVFGAVAVQAGAGSSFIDCQFETGFSFAFTGDRSTLFLDDASAVSLQDANWPITNADVDVDAGQQEFFRIWVPAVFAANVPSTRYNQTTAIAATTFGKIDVPDTMQFEASSKFVIDKAAQTITWTGRQAVCDIKWHYVFNVLVNPNAVGYAGVNLIGQTAPKFLAPMNFNAVTTTLPVWAHGGGSLDVVNNVILWPGMRMGAGAGIAADQLGIAELAFSGVIRGRNSPV